MPQRSMPRPRGFARARAAVFAAGLCCALFASVAPTAAAAPGEPFFLVWGDPSAADMPLRLKVYEPLGSHAGSLGGAVASDASFGHALGAKPVLFVFPADLQGDGADEVVQVRLRPLKKGKIADLQARAFLPPPVFDGDAKKVASTKKKSLGSGSGDGAVVLVASADVDGDGRDEGLVVRAFADGRQSLEVRRFPKKKNKPMKPPIADDATFGDTTSDVNVVLCGADWDGDGTEEIVAVRQALAGPQRLYVFEPPSGPGGETGAPIASHDDLSTYEGGGFVLAAARVDLQGDGRDEIALLRNKPLGGVRLDVTPLPVAPSAGLGAPLFTVEEIGGGSGGPVPLFAGVLEGYVAVPPPPPADLSGTWRATFAHVVEGVPETFVIEPVPAAMGGGKVQFLFPTFHAWTADYDPADGSLDFGSTAWPLDLPQNGAHYALVLGPGKAEVIEGAVRIELPYAGSKEAPGPDPAVTNGTLLLERL